MTKPYQIEEQVFVDDELRDPGLYPMRRADLGIVMAEDAAAAARQAGEDFANKTASAYGLHPNNLLFAKLIARGEGSARGEYAVATASLPKA